MINTQFGKNQKVKVKLNPKDISGNPANITYVIAQSMGGVYTRVNAEDQTQPYSYFWIEGQNTAGNSQVDVRVTYRRTDNTEGYYSETIYCEVMENPIQDQTGVPITLGIEIEPPISI